MQKPSNTCCAKRGENGVFAERGRGGMCLVIGTGGLCEEKKSLQGGRGVGGEGGGGGAGRAQETLLGSVAHTSQVEG